MKIVGAIFEKMKILNFFLCELDIECERDWPVGLDQGSSIRGPRAACGPRATFVRPGKGISQNTMRYEN